MIRWAALLAGLALATGCAAATPYWQKDWRYGAVAGNPRAAAVVAATGATHLLLGADHVVDPLGEDCQRGVSYADLRHRSRAALAAHIGRAWRFPAGIDRPGSVAGWVRCGGGNLVPVAFVGLGEGYRFFEDGLVIRLR